MKATRILGLGLCPVIGLDHGHRQSLGTGHIFGLVLGLGVGLGLGMIHGVENVKAYIY